MKYETLAQAKKTTQNKKRKKEFMPQIVWT
jgi:hypothetical protein